MTLYSVKLHSNNFFFVTRHDNLTTMWKIREIQEKVTNVVMNYSEVIAHDEINGYGVNRLDQSAIGDTIFGSSKE